MTPSNGGTLWLLVKALALLPCLGSAQDRNFLVRVLGDRLDTILQIEESAKAHAHLFNIVEVVREMDEGTIHLREVERIIDEHTALPLWPEEEREELFALLRGVAFPDLVELYRQVAGVGVPELPAETSYREVFYTLETLNAEPDGLPKPLLSPVYVVRGRTAVVPSPVWCRRSELAIELRTRVDRQTRGLGVITELQKIRRESQAPPPGPPPNAPAYLVLLLRRVGLTGDTYQLDSWSQLDLSEGWHPERGEDFTGPLEAIKRQVAVLIEAVEVKWARYQPDIRIEMVLSGDLLNLDVDQWSWEVDSSLEPIPIGCRYAFAIRSLERMLTLRWHRSWHARWRVLNEQVNSGAIVRESGHRADPGDTIRKLVADFENHLNVVSLTLSKPPDPAQVCKTRSSLDFARGYR